MDLTEAEDIRRGGKNTRTVQKRPSRPRYYEGVIDHSPRARHSGMQSQVGLRKHSYEQS